MRFMMPVSTLTSVASTTAATLLCLATTVAAAQPMKAFRTMNATGTFDVKVLPQQPDNEHARNGSVGRLALDKRFHGPLQGQSQGEMLAFGDGREHGAYVAVEKFTGSLDGRSGSFALVHRSLMRNAKPEQWQVLVVPGSGSGALAGIDGAMTITIEGGVHRYTFEYTLPQ